MSLLPYPPNNAPFLDPATGLTSKVWAAFFDKIVLFIVPTGSMMPYAGNDAPSGWLLCDGQAVSRSKFSNLFDALGTKFGVGDGSTTFNLPNTVNRHLKGVAVPDVGSTGGATEYEVAIDNLPVDMPVTVTVTDPNHFHSVPGGTTNDNTGTHARASTGTATGLIFTDLAHPQPLPLVPYDPEDIPATGTGITVTAVVEGLGEPLELEPPFVGVQYIIKY